MRHDRLIARLEAALGDPLNPEAPLSFRSALDTDESEAFPKEAVALAQRIGLSPFADGEMWHFEDILAKTRVLSRRDLTVAVALGQTLLGAIPVLLEGDVAMRATLSQRNRASVLGCLALTEREHGSDLAATEVRARPSGEGFALTGVKWLINNATYGGTVTVLANTSATDRPELSLLYLDKPSLDPSRYHALDKIRTHGIRAADIAGLAFADCAVPPDALVGRAGSGFEITLKTLQISRILCSGFSVGAMDTALRTATQFAVSRQLYRAGMLDIAVVRSRLAGAFVDALICQVVSRMCHRAIHVHRGALSLISAIAKYFVPNRVEGAIRDCGRILGARHYIREGESLGIFQKCMRDHEVVSLFDGSASVNLNVIASHLPSLAKNRRDPQPAHSDDLRSLLDFRHDLAPCAFPRSRELAIASDHDPIVDALLTLRRLVARPDQRGGCETIPGMVEQLYRRSTDLDAAVLTARSTADFDPRSSGMFGLAEQYSAIFAATACTFAWTYASEASGLLGESDWLMIALHRLGVLDGPPARHHEDKVLGVLVSLVERGRPLAFDTISAETRQEA